MVAAMPVRNYANAAAHGRACQGMVAGYVTDDATHDRTLDARAGFGLHRCRGHDGAGRQQQRGNHDLGFHLLFSVGVSSLIMAAQL